jgi:hypothetical protein
MELSAKALVFVCSGSKCNEEKASVKIANYLQQEGLADIGDNTMLVTHFHELSERLLIFINDCKGGCIKAFTSQLLPHQYLYLDLTQNASSVAQDFKHYIATAILPNLRQLTKRQELSLSEAIHSA